MGKKNGILPIAGIIVVVVAFICVMAYFVTGTISKKDSSNSELISSASSKDKEQKEITAQPSDVTPSMSSELEEAGVVQDSFEGSAYDYFSDKPVEDIIEYSNTKFLENMEMDESGKIVVKKELFTTDSFSLPVKIDEETQIEIDFYNRNKGVCFVGIDGAAGSFYYDVYRTIDGGKTWSKSDNVVSVSGAISRVFTVGEETVYLISSNNAYNTDVLYVSKDNAGSFSLVEKNLLELDNAVIYPLYIDVKSNVLLYSCYDGENVTEAYLYSLDGDMALIEKKKIM